MLEYPRPREVAHSATLLGGAILPADRLVGRGGITSISGTMATGWVRLCGGEKERWNAP